jgi:peptide/nickel transport system substrate-binding protein
MATHIPIRANRVLFMGCLVITCVATLSLMGILSCSFSKPHPEAGLKIALDTPPKNLHPLYAFDASSQMVDELLFLSLITLDANLQPQCSSLCSGFSIQTSPPSLAFHLSDALIRGDLKYSDGLPITPEDVLHSLKSTFHRDSPLSGAFQVVQDVRLHMGGKQLTLSLHHLKPSLVLDLFLVKIAPKRLNILESKDIRSWTFSGPYQLESWEENQVVLTRNPHGASTAENEKQLNPTLKLSFIRDDQTRTFKFMNKEVDLLFNSVPPHMLEELKTRRQAKCITRPGLSLTYLGFNHQKPELQDSRVRRLFYETLNLDEVIRYKLYGLATKHFSLLPISSPFVDQRSLETYTQPMLNTSQREALIRKLQGHTFQFKTSNSPAGVSQALAILDQWRQAGIKVDHRPMEFGAFLDDLKEGNFELFLSNFVGITDPIVYYDFFHPSFFPPAGRNRVRFNHAGWNLLAEQLSREIDFNRKVQLSQKLQALMYEATPIAPLWIRQNSVLVQPNKPLPVLSERSTLLDVAVLP